MFLKHNVFFCAGLLAIFAMQTATAQQPGAYPQYAQPQQYVPQQQPYAPQQPQYVPQQPYPPQQQPAYPPQQQAPPQSQWGGQTPIIVPPVSFVDINTGRFGKLEINLTEGVFMDGAVDNLGLVAQNLDLAQGTLAALGIDIKGGHFQDFTIDRLTLNTQGALNFDTGALLNRRMLQFNSPVLAKVNAVISQKSLNAFLNSPRTLERLAVTAQKKGAALISSFLGPNASFGLTIAQASAQLLPANRMALVAQANLGIGQMAVPVPLELNTQLSLANGWIQLADTHLSTSGQEISPEISQAVVRKVNGLSQWGQKSDDIHFTFTDMKVLPNDRIMLSGTAEIYRLRFGRSS
jgi:hypothetical protein